MNIDSNLLKEFAKITNDSEQKSENKYLRGTIVKNSGGKYVQLDGSTTVTPISELVEVEEGDRVLVSIENHKATIVGNFTFPPSARKEQEAIDKSNAAQESAGKAETTANVAQQKAQEASEKADTAISQSSIASASANEAKQQATEAINKANDAQENIQEAKDLATQASSDATEAKQQAAASQASSAEAQAEVTRLQGEVDAAKEDVDKALEDLETQAGEITAIKETYSTKVEVNNTKAELETSITKKVGELETEISETYSTKTENVALEGKLQTQITQNSEGLTSQASKIEKIEADTTEAQKDVADALSKANAAQSAASEAQTKANAAQSAADQASADAADAASKATIAQNAASQATAAANAADQAVQAAQGDLNEAKQNLASVTSRVDATEAEIAEAQQKVDAAQTSVNEALADAAEANAAATKAQEAADKAQTDAETAQGVANAAQTKADNAKTAADNAQTAANKAQADVAALTSRVTTAETKIEQNNQAISLNASKTEEIGTKVDNFKVGGRNYILQSKGTYKITINESTGYNIKILDISPALKEIDPSIKTFSISYDAYSENGGTKLQGYLRASDSTAAMSTTTPALGTSTTSWARYHRIGVINDGYTVADIANFYVRIEKDSTSIDTVYVKNIKVEVGNTPTDWTPAPEDIENELATNYYTKTQTDAQIKVQSDRITSTVSRVETVEKTAVVSSVEQFYLSTSPTALSGGSWATTQPTWTEGKYIWRRTYVTKGDGTTSYQPSQNGVCITGNTGSQGPAGTDGKNYWLSYNVIDLTNTTTYDANKWYPIIGTHLATETYRRIVVYSTLGSSGKPSWATHGSGFSVTLDLASLGSGWGTTKAETIIYADTFSHCSVSPASYYQLTYGSIPVLYLRGGGKYYVKTDYDCTWTPKPEGYTWTSGQYSQTAAVFDSRPNPAGTNIKGKTSYLHIAYATDATGTNGFSITDSANKTYIGQYTDFTEEDSLDPTKYSWTLIKGSNGINGIDGVNGISLSNGRSLYKDVLFLEGTNSCNIYNNSQSTNATVSVTRQTKSTDNPYSDAEFELMIKTIGAASPGWGGIHQNITARANAIFVRRLIAKIPVGYSIMDAQNTMGNGFKITWLTSKAGTGKFQEYMYMVNCGSTGTFSTGGHMYIKNGTTPTEDNPLIWYVASCETFDITTMPVDLDKFATSEDLNSATGSLDTRVTEAKAAIDQLADMISTLVTDENGTSMMTQTSTGWTFNLSAINGNFKAIQDGLSDLSGDQTSTADLLSKVKDLVDAIDKKTAYIDMGTDDSGNPCIELGKKTDDPNEKIFKVRITNTAIDFMEGSSIIAYANNNTFYAEKMIVKNELQIGNGPGFVWRTRANGNMGLVYISG